MKRINLGCGQRFHSEWLNIDFKSNHPEVVEADILKGLPFENGTFSVVYHSHLLEHFKKEQAVLFLHDCYRILAPEGCIRVVVPDLEQIVRCYLKQLEKASLHDDSINTDYDWIIIELLDQIVRDQPGGDMLQFILSNDLCNRSFIIERIGREGVKKIELAKKKKQNLNASWSDKLEVFFQKIKRWGYGKEILIRLLLGREDYQALKIGRFRKSGEIHQWMYDYHSLKSLLKQCGFVDIKRCIASESRIVDWQRFNLDTEPDGTLYKPDSLYMEATKSIQP